VFSALVREQVIDELFLSFAAKLAGGDGGMGITHAPELPRPAAVRLDGVLERAGTLFLRYGFAKLAFDDLVSVPQ
jgi:hypothetical protein